VAWILDQPPKLVKQKLEEHWDHMMELCSSDVELKKLAFYSQWAQERMARASAATMSRPDDPVIWTTHLPSSQPNRSSTVHLDLTGRDDQVGSSSTSMYSALPRNIYDIAQHEDIHVPVDPAVEEKYDRLPAACTEDICPLHFTDLAPLTNILDDELKALIDARAREKK
ncbi:hypothetical protein BGZ65_003351, partial [Modicella reniformis]